MGYFNDVLFWACEHFSNIAVSIECEKALKNIKNSFINNILICIPKMSKGVMGLERLGPDISCSAKNDSKIILTVWFICY